MRKTSNEFSHKHSQEPMQFQGGEKKVMKKSLSLVVTGALVTSMFASAAFAASDLTSQQKFDALKAAGIVSGYPDGTSGLNKNITRAEFTKVLDLLSGLAEDPSAANYKDVSANHWAKGYIGAATKAGLVNGLGNNLFGPSQNVTIEQVAKTLVLTAGLEVDENATVSGTVAPWAKGYVAAAIEAGFIAPAASYKVGATRELVVNAAYEIANASQAVTVKSVNVVDEKNIEVTFSDNQVVKKTLDTALVAGQATKVSVDYNGKTYEVEATLAAASISKAEQTNKGEITISFNRALSAGEKSALTFDVKNGLVPYTLTAKWADDSKSVALSTNFLPAGEYDVTVKGFAAVKVTVADEKAAKVEITTTSLQKAIKQDPAVKLYNQFGKEIANPSLDVTVYNATQSKTVTKDTYGTYDLSSDSVAKVDDTIVVTASHTSGLTASKSFKVVSGSAATSIKLGTVAPLKDKTRISAGETGLILPIELTDQYGTKIKLPETSKTAVAAGANSFVIGGITFMLSQQGVVSNYAVDKDGVLTIDVAKSATLVINALNLATGATASTTVQIAGPSIVSKLQLSNPGVLVAAGEEVVIPFAAVDNFNAPLAGKDLKLGTGTDELNITSSVPFTKKVNAKGQLVFTFDKASVTAATTAYIYAYVNGAQVGSLTLTVNPKADPKMVNGIKDVATTYEDGASNAFDGDNITFVDTYGRTKAVSSVTDVTYSVVPADTSIVTYEGGKLVAQGKAGSSKVTVSLNGVANSSYEFTVTVVDSADVKSYGIKSIGTIYGKDGGATGGYIKGVELVGKTSTGTEVALAKSAPDFVTSSDESIIKTASATSVAGVKAGKATVSAYVGSSKVAEQEVTVSTDAPVAKTVTFGKEEYTVAPNGKVTVSVEVKDQYGVVISNNGLLTSSDTKVASTTLGSLEVTGVAKGTATLTYVTTNGVTATTTIVVE
ncbi:S-layer homology domain-containing protein [Paenibacillus beijingensis]|uniref:SLH domain-containing protein n=1 Tax=Paenibacillus beijingensis TaxID=1126833 RepID=A0A0D5NGW3_9BACL|nr:S-layer homology domain-containing protein [Paenibacillus beijingensis]AJY74526.1 hypothetical protein VN24_08020 [Paenibacillus beijingensis]